MSPPNEIRQPRFAPPDDACEILLVRHGESEPLPEGQVFPLVGGHADPALHSTGEDQAVRVADRLISTGERIDAIYVTTLRRTHQTAAPLAERLGVEPMVEPELREVFLGDWEGGELRRRVRAEDPIVLRMRAEQRWDVIPGAEPTDEFESRVRCGIENIARVHPGRLVVAVVHGGVIGQVMNIAAGVRGFAFNGADNASISHIVVSPDGWVVRCFNDTSHLTPTFTRACHQVPGTR